MAKHTHPTNRLQPPKETTQAAKPLYCSDLPISTAIQLQALCQHTPLHSQYTGPAGQFPPARPAEQQRRQPNATSHSRCCRARNWSISQGSQAFHDSGQWWWNHGTTHHSPDPNGSDKQPPLPRLSSSRPRNIFHSQVWFSKLPQTSQIIFEITHLSNPQHAKPQKTLCPSGPIIVAPQVTPKQLNSHYTIPHNVTLKSQLEPLCLILVGHAPTEPSLSPHCPPQADEQNQSIPNQTNT